MISMKTEVDRGRKRLDTIVSYDIHAFLHYHITAEGRTKELITSDNKNSTRHSKLKLLGIRLAQLVTKQLKGATGKKHEVLLSMKLNSQSLVESEKEEECDSTNMQKNSLPTVKEDEIAIDSPEGEQADEIETFNHFNFERVIVEAGCNSDGENITSRHQVLVEVVEAVGLCHPIADYSNPFTYR